MSSLPYLIGFSSREVEQLSSQIDLNVHVLTSGFWPSYPTMPHISIPLFMAPYQNIFEKFYCSKHRNRELTWLHSLGQCTLNATFPKGNKLITVSFYQTVVLLCFNTSSRITFTEIKEVTGMEDGELRRTLQSLACGQVRVISKEPKGREISDDDVFHFNESFSNERLRIKINSIQLKETPKEDTETLEQVIRDRQYQIDAAVVRIMKSRRTLSHAVLMSELFSHLTFAAAPADIKRRIESLIDREYMQRDENRPQFYTYKA